MKRVLLSRLESSMEGTFGVLSLEGAFICFTAELPWLDNQRQVSCIPEGLYNVSLIRSPRFGLVYCVADVPNRSNILFHKGNFVGSVAHGLKSNSYGCILPALRIGRIENQKAGLISAPAVMKMQEVLEKKPFMLEIRNA